jgi:peptidoglycan/xylan/chitin deacetylase (PgdA/CDA1 family)
VYAALEDASVTRPAPDTWAAWLQPGRLAFFLFHGVIPQRRPGVRNYTEKHLAADEFEAIMESLCTNGTPVCADQALATMRKDEPLPDRAFLISFDDGFRNNLTVAAPILDGLGIPALVYITTGFVENGDASWIDLIEFAVERTELETLRLPWEEAERQVATAAQRRALLDDVRRVLKSRHDLDPYEHASAIMQAAGVPVFEPDPQLDAKLSWDEVRELDRRPLWRVGGHTRTHRILAFLDPDDLRQELDDSIGALERELGRPLVHFSYPEGTAESFSPPVIEALKARGIEMCPTAEAGCNAPGDDLFHLRRILVA